MKLACVNLIQNFQISILAMLKLVSILNVKTCAILALGPPCAAFDFRSSAEEAIRCKLERSWAFQEIPHCRETVWNFCVWSSFHSVKMRTLETVGLESLRASAWEMTACTSKLLVTETKPRSLLGSTSGCCNCF